MADKPLEDIISCPYCHCAIAIRLDGKIQRAKVEWIKNKPIPVIELPESAKTEIKTNGG